LAQISNLSGSDVLKTMYPKINSNFGNVNAEVAQTKEDIQDKTDNLQAQIDVLVTDGDSSPEAAQARVNTSGVTKPSLKVRLDDDFNDLSNQIGIVTGKLLDTVTISSPSGNVTTDTAAWNAAISSLANDGELILTHGDYYITGGNLKSNITIRARGVARILSDGNIFTVNSGSVDVANNISNITFEYVKFESTIQTFSEQIHQLRLSGVSDITFKRCIFKGFRGDGVYLGSGDAGQERHNENIHFEKCIFDGVNKQNRNAISIIDGDGIYIDKCIFKNCTQPNMPGAIDIEPNPTNTWAIIRNIHIRNCKFKNIGGNTGVVGMYIPISQSQLTNPVENITVEGCSIDTTTDTQSAFHFRQVPISAIDDTYKGLNIKVLNNKGKNLASRPFILIGVKNATISKNDFENAGNSALVGYTGTTDKCVFVKLKDNAFKKCGTADGKGLGIFTVDRLDIIRNIFEDCGITGNTNGYGIDFNQGTTSKVRIVGCDFLSPNGIMSTAIQKEASHTFTSSTNTDQQNRYNGLINTFVADLKDPSTNYRMGSYDTTKLPDSFTHGVEISVVNGDTNLPSSYKQGLLRTTVPTATTGYRKFITQWFEPANNESVTLADMYFRKANISTNDWSAWKKVTGV